VFVGIGVGRLCAAFRLRCGFLRWQSGSLDHMWGPEKKVTPLMGVTLCHIWPGVKWHDVQLFYDQRDAFDTACPTDVLACGLSPAPVICRRAACPVQVPDLHGETAPRAPPDAHVAAWASVFRGPFSCPATSCAPPLQFWRECVAVRHCRPGGRPRRRRWLASGRPQNRGRRGAWCGCR